MVVLAVACTGLLFLSVRGRSVRAQEARIRWLAPPECVERKEMERRLAGIFAAAALPLQVSARVQRWSGGFRLDLDIKVGSRNLVRRLQSFDCNSLADSAALLVALAVGGDRRVAASAERSPQEPQARAQPLAPERAEQAEPSPQTEPAAAIEVDDGRAAHATQTVSPVPPASAARVTTAPPPRDRAAATPPRPERFPKSGLSAGVAGGLLAGALPKRAASLAGDVTLELSRWSLGLRVGNLFAGSQRLGADASLHYRASYLALRGCAGFALGRLTLGPCMAIWLQRLEVHANGLGPARQGPSNWISLGLGAFSSLRVWRGLQATAEAGALLPLSERPEVDVLDLGEAAQVRPLVGYALLGLRQRFW